MCTQVNFTNVFPSQANVILKITFKCMIEIVNITTIYIHATVFRELRNPAQVSEYEGSLYCWQLSNGAKHISNL